MISVMAAQVRMRLPISLKCGGQLYLRVRPSLCPVMVITSDCSVRTLMSKFNRTRCAAFTSAKVLNWRVHVRPQLSICSRCQGSANRTHTHLAHAPGGPLYGRVSRRAQAVFAD